MSIPSPTESLYTSVDPNIFASHPELMIRIIKRALKHPSVPGFLIPIADATTSTEDLVQDCYLHLMTRVPRYRPERQPFCKWVYHKSIRFLQSYFAQLSNRKRLRQERAESAKLSKKGVVRGGKVYDLPPASIAESPEDWGTGVTNGPDNYQENVIYDELHLQPDMRPRHEFTMDLDSLIPQMPENLKTIAELLREGHQLDYISWTMKLHPTRVSQLKEKVLEWLRERMS